MRLIRREALFMKLAAVEAKDKQTQSTLQSIGAARKTAGTASQAGQIVTEFCVIGFHRIGICLALRGFVSAPVIPEPLIGIQAVTVIPPGLGCLIDKLLKGRLAAYPNDGPGQNTAGVAIYKRENEDSVFLSPMKVNSSSISAVFTSLGTGASGKPSATSATQFAML